MNYKSILNVIGKVLLFESAMMLLPLTLSLVYGENNYLCYLLPAIGLFSISFPLLFIKNKTSIHAKEGFIIVALSWLAMSLVGAIPFVFIAKMSYIDAFFETVSGFTTTGATVVADIEALPKSLLFWRSFTHFIGGMGVLVFLLIVLPGGNGNFYLFKAESPGLSATKYVSKIKLTAKILYSIYIALTVTEAAMLILGGMPIFDSITTALSTAGTGGFAVKNASIAAYNSVYFEMVIAAFMFLFGINFNVFFLLITGRVLKAFKSEEFRFYLIMITVATLLIAVNILSVCENFGQAIRYSFFQVAAFSSTTGFVTTDFNEWNEFSKVILVFLTFVGACGGSTGGGFKVSRLIVLGKAGLANIKKSARPRSVIRLRLEGETLNETSVSGVTSLFIIWFAMVVISMLVISFDGYDFTTNFSASMTTLSNVGPGLGNVIGGTGGSFAGFSTVSKIMLSINMLAGRLELIPVMALFYFRTWMR